MLQDESTTITVKGTYEEIDSNNGLTHYFIRTFVMYPEEKKHSRITSDVFKEYLPETPNAPAP